MEGDAEVTKPNRDDGLPPRKVEVNGVTLVAEELPKHRGGSKPRMDAMWIPVIEKFLLMGEESMRVDIAGRKGKSIYESLNKWLKKRTERRVYASCRGGACYLVRVPVKGAR
jgi:hypothetical protein